MSRRSQSRVRRSEEQWVEIIRQFESSGLSARDFCRRRSMSVSSFQRWRRRLGSSPGGFIELTPEPAKPSSNPSWSLEVSLPSGVQLRFEG